MIAHYISLTKPRICLMVAISTYLGYYLGIRYSGSYMTELSEWLVFSHLIVGTLFSCAGACTLNQALEYKADSKMERTKNRSIPKGELTPLQGIISGSFLSILGIIYLALFKDLIILLFK